MENVMLDKTFWSKIKELMLTLFTIVIYNVELQSIIQCHSVEH
jgi:hypothetical protein